MELIEFPTRFQTLPILDILSHDDSKLYELRLPALWLGYYVISIVLLDPIEKVDVVNINRNEAPMAREDGYGKHNKTALKSTITIFSTSIYGNLSFNKIKTFSLDFYLLFLFVIEPSRSRKERLNGKWRRWRSGRSKNKGKHFVVHGKLSFKAFFIFILVRSERKAFRSQENHSENVERSRFFPFSAVPFMFASQMTATPFQWVARDNKSPANLATFADWSIIHLLSCLLVLLSNFVTVNYKLFVD